MEYAFATYTKWARGTALVAVLFIGAFAGAGARAESTTTVIGGGGTPGGSQSIVNEKAGGSMVSPSGVADNGAANAKNGREFKANDAQKQGNAGKVAAIIAGSGMVASAIPLLASLEPIQVAAGATLMGMAGLEFAQAAASGGAANKNGDQKNVLTKDDDKAAPSSGGDPRADAASAVRGDPALTELLQSRGVNPDDFANALASGQLTDPQAVLNAVGNKVNISPDALAQGQAAAANFVSGSLEGKPEKQGLPEIVRVTNNDDVAKGGSEAAKTAGGSGGVGKAEATGGAAGGAAPGTTSAGVGKPGATGAVAKGKDATDKNAGQFAAAGQASILDLFGRFGIAAPKVGGAFPVPKSDSDWVKLGILRGNPRQNIFQLGHRNYRSFHKWRQSTLLAKAIAAAKAEVVAAKAAAGAAGTRVTQADAIGQGR